METVEHLSLHLLDVGKGDAMLIDFPDGSFGLVDTGPSEKGIGVVEHIKARAGKKFRFAAITHWDADHAAGMPVVLGYGPIRYYTPNVSTPLLEKLAPSPTSSSRYRHEKSALLLQEEISKARGDAIHEPLYARKILDAPAAVNLVALSPDVNVEDDLLDELRPGMTRDQVRRFRNRLSAVLWLRFGDTKLLLAGEVEEEQYDRMIKLWRHKVEPLHGLYGSPQAHWIKLSHHGAEDNNPPSLFQHFSMGRFVASASTGGRYGHPHPTVLHLVTTSGGVAMCTRLGQGCGHILHNKLDPDPKSWIAGVRISTLPNPKQACYGEITVDVTVDRSSGRTSCAVRGSASQKSCLYGGPPSGSIVISPDSPP